MDGPPIGLMIVFGAVIGAITIIIVNWGASELPYWAIQDITEKSVELCDGSGGVKNIELPFRPDIGFDKEKQEVTSYPNVTCKNGAYHNL